MFIVKIGQSKKHSIWETYDEADNQRRVLIDHGYTRGKVHVHETEETEFPNGHYFC